ncbi:30S ribosomal protein S8 [Columbia Basin potato purple top phytoplasma]|uniref:Small ribosomal subunit protein uS8 n=1 Tax=Columbia Basin potato purple top phytoplasma TaxID=307134 RepID=A0ABT5L9L2_9MOLU|nr:30S ribosomal protein S8 [Columbia Basin potato purple top phytoplasma]MDC9031971.1 30S ribosomal protein S8 [Columbia Basin potato purple top phytoplasma]
MMIKNPIADLLTRIRNANIMFYNKVSVPASKLKIELLKVMKKEGFIQDFRVEGSSKKSIIIYLKYHDKKQRAILGLKRVSKNVSVKKIPRVLNGLGIALISTSKGILTDYEAISNNIGGQVLAYIW